MGNHVFVDEYGNILVLHGKEYVTPGQLKETLTETLITPGSIDQYEVIPVGPGRRYKTLAEAYVYMQTKNMGSKGFQLVLDPGSYAGITYYNCNVKIISADTAQKAIVTSKLSVLNSSLCIIENVDFSAGASCAKESILIFNHCSVTGGITYDALSYGEVSNSSVIGMLNSWNGAYCAVTQSTIEPCQASAGGTMALVNCTVNENLALSKTVVQAANCGVVRIINTRVAGSNADGTIGVQAITSGDIIYQTTGSVINGFATGLQAQFGSLINAPLASMSITNCATQTSPAAGTVGNEQSYIYRG